MTTQENLTKNDMVKVINFANNKYGDYITNQDLEGYLESSFLGGNRECFGISWHSGHSHLRMTVELMGDNLKITTDFKIFQEGEWEDVEVIGRELSNN